MANRDSRTGTLISAPARSRPIAQQIAHSSGQIPANLDSSVAKYIFYTETSREFDRARVNEKTGKIGEHKGTSYYLLYTSDGKRDRALDMPWLEATGKVEKNRNLVVYCEKIWIHRDDLAKYQAGTKRTVRPMLVPFGLK